MKLLKEIILKSLESGNVQISLSGDIERLVEMQCYRTLKKIKEIIEDDALDDKECFEKIELIIKEFEAIGSNGGSRHDFG